MPRISCSFNLPTVATPAAQSFLQLHRPMAATISVTLTYLLPLRGILGISFSLLSGSWSSPINLIVQAGLNWCWALYLCTECQTRATEGLGVQSSRAWFSNPWGPSLEIRSVMKQQYTWCLKKETVVFCTSSHWIPRQVVLFLFRMRNFTANFVGRSTPLCMARSVMGQMMQEHNLLVNKWRKIKMGLQFVEQTTSV